MTDKIPIAFYAGITNPPLLEEETVVIENPVIYNDHIDRYLLSKIEPNLCMIITESSFGIPTLIHLVGVSLKSEAHQLTITDEIFHKHQKYRITFPSHQESAVVHALSVMNVAHMQPRPWSHIPSPIRPTHCLLPRIRLTMQNNF